MFEVDWDARYKVVERPISAKSPKRVVFVGDWDECKDYIEGILNEFQERYDLYDSDICDYADKCMNFLRIHHYGKQWKIRKVRDGSRRIR